MATLHSTLALIQNAWPVLSLFLIPVGGGIPAGVLLAQSRGIQWPEMSLLYFISDVILACVFEPLMLLLARAGNHSERMRKFNMAFKKSMDKMTSKYGLNLGPWALVMVAFGVDPMTGRLVAFKAGHGFVTGWAIAITGDMIFFTLIMVSTLMLNNILGDGTWTAIIIMAAMFVVPGLLRKFRERRGGLTSKPKAYD